MTAALQLSTPRSVCSESCPVGTRKIIPNVTLFCCFNCIPCSEGEITNMTDMDNCLRCPDEEWPNLLNNKCIKRTVDFLSFSEYLGAIFTSAAILFFIITSTVLMIFMKYRRTPIVTANNQNLSYILLVSLMLSFLCPILFIGHPSEITCMMRQTATGLIFAIAISSVLGKTITVIIAFNATKPGSKLRKLVGSKITIAFVPLCSSGELLICIIWLICSAPFVDYDTKTVPGTIILQCNEGSILAFYLTISYIGVLALLSFCVAFFARKLPDSFNEAQFITFSMLVVCSVWASFIPAYLSTKGKYTEVVEIFAIFASALGLFGCIFIPKCYIIVCKPQLNTKKHLITKKSIMSSTM
ncbi:vomeronasal type-2 receptor 26-like [Bombina bombina]|uniref:vomeronasal type-2 receptor 26-like n=1 Tax=Bombina bombina TaxID=8345 RepID=UPI00235A90C9|nr:vomeronasal type-2 receptor 26-like [Bombina bombina]